MKRVLGGLGQIAAGIPELRNSSGRRESASPDVNPPDSQFLLSSAPALAPDPAELRTAERGRELEAVARHPVHPAVGNEDRSDRRDGHASDRQAEPRDRHAREQVVREVIDDRADAQTCSMTLLNVAVARPMTESAAP